MSIKIETPRGQIIQTPNGTAKLVWNPGFGAKLTGQFNKAQVFVDSEVLRLSDKYVPMRTGALKLSGTLGTVVGSGEVKYVAPYAKAQYYSKRSPGSATGTLRGPYWFQRMKNSNGTQIMTAAAKIAGGKFEK